MKKIRRDYILFSFFSFFACLILVSHKAYSSCDVLSDDFSNSLTAVTTYKFNNANWKVQSGRLNVSNIDSQKIGVAQRNFFPETPFSLDIDVDFTSVGDSQSYVGLYVFTSGDVFFDVNGTVTDGVAVTVNPNQNLMRFEIWNVLEGTWEFFGPFEITGPVHSFGLTMAEDQAVFRLNGVDTNISLNGSFNAFDQVLDTLWIEAAGSIVASFDNLCAEEHTVSIQNGSPTYSSGMDVPTNQNIYPFVADSAPSTTGAKPELKPMGLGPMANGGSTMDLTVGLPSYSSPIDIYLALTTSLTGDEIFLFDSDSNLVSGSGAGLVAWKRGQQAPVSETVLSGIPVKILSGMRIDLYLVIVPSGSSNFDNFDIWATEIDLTGGSENASGPSDEHNNGQVQSSVLRDEVTPLVDNILSSFSTGSALLDELSGILQGGASDIVTITPQLTLPPPKNITVTVDFGSGYALSNGAMMSGLLKMDLSNVYFDTTGLGADFIITANDVKKDGSPVLNGNMSGTLNMTQSSSGGSNGDLTGSLDFGTIQVQGTPLSGNLGISGTNINMSDLLFDNITLTPSGLTYGGLSISSGTIALSRPTASNTNVVMDVQTSQGPISLNVDISQSGTSHYELNSRAQGNAMGYDIRINGIVYDSSVCKGYPIGGSMILSKGGATATVTFTNACDGTYNYSEQ